MKTAPLTYQRIRDLREDKNLTQKQVAQILHLSQNTYSRYETQERSLPIEILCQLADLYHTSTDYLLNRTDVLHPYPKKTKKFMGKGL